MSLRISSALALLAAVAACAEERASPPPSVPDSADQPSFAVDCAIGAVADLTPVCTLEQVAATGEIVIHHPDGGFRRFIHDPKTGAIAPLDGAEPLVSQAGSPGALRFAVGEDRYSIPAERLTRAPE